RPVPSTFLATLSPLRRNSVISSNGSRTPEESLASQTMATTTAGSSNSISRQKLNLSQLDPRTFADVHSSGLTSRIAAYHENSLGGRGSGSGAGGLQRSMSVSNLYSPLSHSRRPAAPPLPYKASVPVLSLTKIAPPERSFYSGNTLSSLMRSNSLVGVGLKTSDQEQLSRENRPILHPPHPQHECEPTRSVLEELKEISRKRINSGVSLHRVGCNRRDTSSGFGYFQDTQSAHDFTKRSCQREDFVDLHQQHHQHHHHQQHHELHRLQQQQHHQSFKRQRELTVAVPLRHNLTSLPVPPPALQHMYSNGAISPRQSPEQVAKRRNCSYSNDIASSLSSSLRHTNKRKLFDMRDSLQQSHNESAASTSSPENSPKSKVQRKVDAESIGRTQSMPIPAVPPVPPARTISAPPAKSHSSEHRPTEAIVPPAAQKPKLTLFNARQPTQTTGDRTRQDLNSPDVDAGEYAGIQFVKPKQQNSMQGVRNPSVERTQKTKLAIMLSGLKGELYQGEPDEPDTTLVPPPAGLPTPIKPISSSVVTSKTTTTTTTTSTTTTTTSTTPAQTIVSPNKPVILSNQVIVPAASTTATTTSTTVPKLSFGALGGTAAAPAPAPVTASASAAAVAPSPRSDPAAAPAPTPVTTDKAPEAGLGNQAKFSLPATSIASGVTSAHPLVTFGSPKPSTAPTLSFGSTTTTTSASSSSTAPLFSVFGQSPATTNGPTVGAATSFKTETTKETTSTTTANSLGTPNTTSLTFGTSTATATVLPRIAPTLNFGQPIAATTTVSTSPFGTAPTASSSMISPPKAAPMFAFGQSSSTANGGTTPAKPPAVFSFGGSSTQATNGATESKPTFGGVFNSKPEPSKPAGIFGSQDTTFGSPFKPPAASVATGAATSTEPANAFAFKTPTTSATTTATNLFTFGGATSTAAKPAEPATSLAFGQSAGTAAATPFSFGGAATAAKETSSNTDANKSVFAFGGSAGGGDKSSSNKPSAALNFGGGDKAAPSPAFGSVAPTVAAVTPTPGPAFAFGTSSKPSTPMFGSNGATATPAATKLFAFGAVQSTPTAAPAPTGGFSLAAVAAKKTEEPSGANLFGSPAAKPSFNFGGNTSNQAAGPAVASPAAPTGGFSFGKKEPAATNVFGSAANANTGVVKPTFGFGGGSNTTTPAPATSSGFGGFGAPTAAPAVAAASQPAAGASNQNKPFAFGGSTATGAPTAAPSIGGNLFASAVAATQNQAKPGGFAFGGAKNSTNSNSTAGNAPFSFGGAAAGGIASPPSNQSMNTAKPFSFGGAGGNPAPSVFGSPAPQHPAPPASNPAGAYNFGGSSSPAQQANAGNMFAPPPENRPFRKATRRLQK
ncbi:hypothetical protein KR200_007266, partial [Drosophila serrata]